VYFYVYNWSTSPYISGMGVRRLTEELLSFYYDLWVAGATDAELTQRLYDRFEGHLPTDVGPGPKVKSVVAYSKALGRHLPTLHSYCRQRVKVKAAVDFASGNLNVTPLTPERRQLLLDYVGRGATLPKVAALLNVPLPTVTYWQELDPDLKVELEVVRDLHDLRIVEALERRALGYELDVEETREESGVGQGGLPISKEVVTKSVRHLPGSVEAQKLWLKNRLGWSDTPTTGTADATEVEYDVRERLYDE